MTSPTRSAIRSPVPDPQLCDVLTCVLDCVEPAIARTSPAGSNSEPKTGAQIPNRIGFACRPMWTRPARQTFEMRHRQALLVVRSRGHAWQGSPRPTGCATVRTSPARWAFRWRWASTACKSSRDPRSRLSPPCLRAAESGCLRFNVLTSSRPSVGSARKGEGKNPRAFSQIETRPPGRWSNARRTGTPAPQSKPVTPASRLVEQNCAVGGIRAGAENSGRRASTDTNSTPIAGVYVIRSPIVCSAHPRARASVDYSG